MTKQERQEIGLRLAVLAEVFGEAMSETRIRGYVDLLADMPYPLAMARLEELAKTSTFFPRPSEIRKPWNEELSMQRFLRGESPVARLLGGRRDD